MSLSVRIVLTFISVLSLSVKGQMLLQENSLAEYEAKIDHRQLIKKQNSKVLAMGKSLYERTCQNCHGNLQHPGSVPNALRFGSGEFLHGKDPYTMYQTLTRGWRFMAPQMQLTPVEKYAVIHYIRSKYLKKHNPKQYFEITEKYLKTLPQGKELGPAPVKREDWREMDYGSFQMGTYEIATASKRKTPWPKGKQPDYVSADANIAYKGIAIRLDPGAGGVSKGKHWLAFEHDTLRIAGAWTGEGFIDWNAIHFNGSHVARPRTIGDPLFETADGPGWANPETGEFKDLRFKAESGQYFGPLPKKWAHFKGIYRYGNRQVISYSVGDAEILESHDLKGSEVIRYLNISKSSKNLKLRLANKGTVVAASQNVKILEEDGFVVAEIAAAATPLKLAFTLGGKTVVKAQDLIEMTRGGSAQWAQTLKTFVSKGKQGGAFNVDTFELPKANPWNSRLRTTGFDFLNKGNSAIVCCWDGDVWRVDGLNSESLTWRRIAAGLYQPLGVKIVKDQIFIICRDQLVRLHDLNSDGEMDFYENFNSDHQVTEHFHEFAMGLQADEDGNFYYAKSACHAREPKVPQHGTLLKITADGSKTEILANGFRAANGVCQNPDGSFFVTDQQGHWTPMNRINKVYPNKRYYGNVWSYGAPKDTKDSGMEQPLAWVDASMDRSPSELVWVKSKKWGALNGSLLNISYGYGRIYIVPHEDKNGLSQGGLCKLPIADLPTGTMRGRFNEDDGQLYVCGMSAWATNQRLEKGGFYRISMTSKASYLPVKIEAFENGIDIEFSEPLASISLKDIQSKMEVGTWGYIRSERYGSKRINSKKLKVKSAKLKNGGKTLSVIIDGIAPTWQMSIKYKLTGADGENFSGEIQNTIHRLGKR
jgi:mono/diheme cytochrome c family protein